MCFIQIKSCMHGYQHMISFRIKWNLYNLYSWPPLLFLLTHIAPHHQQNCIHSILTPSLTMTIYSSIYLMSFHLLFSAQNKCSVCFNYHVFLSPSPTASVLLKINDYRTMYFFHQLTVIKIIKSESCTSIIHSHTCIVMHARRKQSN